MSPESVTTSVGRLCDLAFGVGAVQVDGIEDVNRGRGAFSVVVRGALTWLDRGPTSPDRPDSVVAKLPTTGPNGEAARRSGAYRRESLAYRQVLPRSPVAHPRPWAVVDGEDGDTCALLLEDLTDRRIVDQLDGLEPNDALAVAQALARFHRSWAGPAGSLGASVRRNTLAGLPAAGLDAGLAALDDRWSEHLDGAQRAVFAELRAAHGSLAERFGSEPATLCHGDPRADNLVFGHDGEPILFDWQQMAVQFGEADLAWLAATSLPVPTRRQVERDLIDAAGASHDRYRLGLALPGLTVLLLAQRELSNERARRFVSTSLQRIAIAVADNETAALG